METARQAVPAPPENPLEYLPDDMGSYPELTVYPEVCRAGLTPGGSLAVEIRRSEWRLHPVGRGFWAPSAVLSFCNGGSEAMEWDFLDLMVVQHGQSRRAGHVRLPALKPGEGTAQIQVYLEAGVPEAIGQLWAADGRRWPAWSLQVAVEEEPEKQKVVAEAPIARRFEGGKLTAGETKPEADSWPDPPTLDQLTLLARSHGIFHDGKQEVTIFLYAPDTQHLLWTGNYCGAVPGMVEAKAQNWGFYVSKAGAPPVRLGEVGEFYFTGARGMTLATVPELETTFLALEEYGACANPYLHTLYAYDHVKGEIYQPRMRYQSGNEGPAFVVGFDIFPDGTLENQFYNNADNFGWHTHVYTWDPEKRLWSFSGEKAK